MESIEEPIQSVWDLLLEALPPYAERVLVTSCGDGRQAVRLANAYHQIHGIDHRPTRVAEAAQRLASARTGSLSTLTPSLLEAPFDCVVIPVLPHGGEAVRACLIAAGQIMAPGGSILLTFPNRRHIEAFRAGDAREASDTLFTEEEMTTLLRGAGYEPYQLLSATEGPPPDIRPGPPGTVLIEGRTIPVSGQEDVTRLLTTRYVCQAVRADYDPLIHARERMANGRPDLAYEILTGIPSIYTDQPDIKAIVSTDKLVCLTQHLQHQDPQTLLQLASLAQSLFFAGTAETFTTRQACHAHAAFWHLLGRDDMARRLLHSIEHIDPSPDTALEIQKYASITTPVMKQPSPPPWRIADRQRHILMVTDNRPNYGLDVLYDGLCHTLGDHNVIEYPRKATLHGEAPQSFCRYPCMFDHPCSTPSFEELLEQLRADRFDVVLFGDMERLHPIEQTRAIAQAAGDRLVFLDQLDTCQDTRTETAMALGLHALPLCFKREYLNGIDYGPGVIPLPFAYSEAYLSPVPSWETRDLPVFWAGERKWGLRRLCLEHIEQRMGFDFSANLSQEAYAHTLSRARISLDFHGFGFDTVRYWEVPAHGGMLLAEQRPTRVPLDFEQGVSAVFFEDTASLEHQIEHYLGHPEETRHIAEAGHRHFMKHHTATARAQHLLGWLALHFGWEEAR